MDITIREAQPGDAAQIITYVNHLSKEPESNLEISPGEFTYTEKEEADILAGFAASPNSLFLVAEIGGKIVGMLNCKGSPRAAIRHAVTLGISVDRVWRRQGVGTQLLENAIAWARKSGLVSRIELSVFERNSTAIHLYEKFGFDVEGKRRRAVFRDGTYLDTLLMALLL